MPRTEIALAALQNMDWQAGGSALCPRPSLGLGAWEKRVLLYLQLSGGKLPPFPENPNSMYLWKLLDLALTMGGYGWNPWRAVSGLPRPDATLN